MADKRCGPRTLCRLFALYARIDLSCLLRDTRYCLLFLFADAICSGASVAGVFLLTARFGGLCGMESDEVLFLLSYSTLVGGVYALLFSGYNMSHISRIIGRGQLDHSLVQPVPIWMQFLAGGFSPFSGSSKLLCGVGLTVYATHRLGGLSAAKTVYLIAGVLCSTAVMAAVINTVSCLAFVAPAAAEEISSTARDPFDTLGGYPLGGLSAVWQTFFCTLVPVGLTAWLPSRLVLDGRFPWPALLGAAAFTALMSVTFQKGMNYYVRYGSPRYSGFGFR